MIEEIKSIEKVEVYPNGVIFCEEATIIRRGEQILAKNNHRTGYHPGDNLTNAPSEVIIIANTIWTEQVVQNYRASQQVEIAAQNE